MSTSHDPSLSSKFDKLENEILEVEREKKKRDEVYETRLLDLKRKLERMLKANSEARMKKDDKRKKKLIKLAKSGTNHHGFSHQEKGGRNVGHSGIKKARLTNNSSGARSKQDNQGKNPEIRGASYGASLSHTCALKIINIIMSNLQKENLELFKKSCFGHLLKINELEFQGQLVLQLLVHMDMAASNKERLLVFNINNSTIKFGLTDFCLVTGLRWGTFDAITTTSSSILKVVAKGRSAILLKNIEKAFLDHKEKGELTFKLALLYFLYGTLLAGNPTKKIDQQYLYLIEDLHKFNEFPWGQVAYELLVSFMLSARRRMDGSKGTNGKPRIAIYGFVFALQVWAYEVMPDVAAYCAFRVHNLKNPIPRILCWSMLKKKVCFNDLKEFFTPGDEANLVLDGIRAAPWELEELATGTIPQPKKGTSLMSHASAPPPSSAAVDNVIIISDDDDDDDMPSGTKMKRRKSSAPSCKREETQSAASNSRSMDSDDDEFFSDTYMDNLVAAVERKSSGK